MAGDTITLSRKNSAQSIQLRRGQTHTVDSDANLDVFSFTGGRPEDTFLASLGEREEREFVGLVTAPKLSADANYSDDWSTALAEYAQELEAFAYSRQHEGYTLTDNHRGDTIDVCVTELEWELEAGAVYQLSYTLTLETGVGAMPDDPISIGSATPGGGWAIDGNDLGNFEYVSVVRSPETQTNVRAFAGGPGENDVITTTAAERVVSFRGAKTGDQATINSFDDTMEALIKNEVVTMDFDFPGYSKDGMVASYDSERQADWGADSLMRYELEFHEGSKG